MSKERRKVRVGRVVSDKMDKTVVVSVQWQTRHPLYRKAQRRITKFYAHDGTNKCTLGDLVRIEETRALSRLKCWRVVDILEHREVAEIKPLELDQSILDAQRRGQAGGTEEVTDGREAVAAVTVVEEAVEEASSEATTSVVTPEAPVEVEEPETEEPPTIAAEPTAEVEKPETEELPTTAMEPTAVVEEPETEEPPTVAAEPTAEVEVAKPRRRASTTKPKPEEQDEAAESEDVTPTTAEEAPAETEAPKPRRRRRSTKATAESETQEPEGETPTVVTEPTAEVEGQEPEKETPTSTEEPPEEESKEELRQ